jgi:hypothetical protein
MIRRVVAGGVVVTSVLLSASALAQSQGRDTIGPSTSVVATRSDVPPSEATSTSARIFVHLEGDPEMVLEKKGAGREWIPVCGAPCDKWLTADATYRVGGDDVRSSRPFALARSPGGRVDLVVDVSTKTAFVGGILLTSIGYSAIPIGLLILLAGAIESSPCAFDSMSPCLTPPSGGGLIAAGAITAIVGAVVGTLGVVELASNVHSKVAQSSDGAADAPPPSASTQLPAWRDTPTAGRALAPAPVALPLCTFTF